MNLSLLHFYMWYQSPYEKLKWDFLETESIQVSEPQLAMIFSVSFDDVFRELNQDISNNNLAR